MADCEGHDDHFRAYVQEAADGELPGEEATILAGIPGSSGFEPG